MENKIIEADIRTIPWKNFRKFIIIGLLLCFFFYLSTKWNVSIEEAFDNGDYFAITLYNMDSRLKYADHSPHLGLCIKQTNETTIISLIVWAIFIGLCFLLKTVSVIARNSASECTLYLDDKGISGVKKTGFFSKSILLPMDKIDSITVQNGIFDKIFGGQTVAIRSASGLIKFPWVQNAQEFVDTTLAEIQKYNESVELRSKPAPTLSPSSSASLTEKLQELQSLKDQGILTEEQFEAKKQQLLANF